MTFGIDLIGECNVRLPQAMRNCGIGQLRKLLNIHHCDVPVLSVALRCVMIGPELLAPMNVWVNVIDPRVTKNKVVSSHVHNIRLQGLLLLPSSTVYQAKFQIVDPI